MNLFSCNFCDCRLRPDPYRWYEWPLVFILVRRYYCPHCGDGALRPIVTLAKLVGKTQSTHLTEYSKKGEHKSGRSRRRRSSPAEREPVDVDDSPVDSDSLGPAANAPPGGPSSVPSTTPSRDTDSSPTGGEEGGLGKEDHNGDNSRKRRRSRRKRTNSAPSQSVRAKTHQLSNLTGNAVPSSYSRSSALARILRRIRRRFRRLFGLSSSRRRSSSPKKETNES